jgi:16S rRNA (guanine966-N2)-methyltransferase
MSGRLRIIAGELGGRLVEVPEQGTRPFADRVRQALFAILEPRLVGADVLDLCAGSGAAGLEALSRGADSALFVDISRRATEVVRRNIDALGLSSSAEVRVGDAVATLTSLASGKREFDLVIADPPYDDLALRLGILRAITANPSPLAAAGLLIISGRKRRGEAAEGAPLGLRLVRTLTFGETLIQLYEREAHGLREMEEA